MGGAFWHGHPSAFTPGKSGGYWDEKIVRNVERDKLANAELTAMGWTVVRLWDFELRRDLNGSVARVLDALGGPAASESGLDDRPSGDIQMMW